MESWTLAEHPQSGQVKLSWTKLMHADAARELAAGGRRGLTMDDGMAVLTEPVVLLSFTPLRVRVRAGERALLVLLPDSPRVSSQISARQPEPSPLKKGPSDAVDSVLGMASLASRTFVSVLAWWDSVTGGVFIFPRSRSGHRAKSLHQLPA